jgi:GlpG protein
LFRVVTVDIGDDLAPFSIYLWQQRIAHRIYEEHGSQVLEVGDPAAAARVREDYAAWRDGRLQLQVLPRTTRHGDRLAVVVGTFMRYPILCGMLVAAVLCLPATFPLADDRFGPVLPWLTIVPIDMATANGHAAGALLTVLGAGQWWRLITPIFVHFSVVHLLFNVAIVVEFGRRIERSAGSLCLALTTLAIGVASNVVQFLAVGAALFGGLSGIAYGLFGYVVVRGRFDAARDWHVNRAFIVVMVLLLVLMSSGITEWFGLYIANAAHWTGLAVGGLLAVLWRPRGRGDAR